MIAESMESFLAGSSVIRAMFEEGKKMAKVYGAENVYDFSVGNPGLHPPKEYKDAINYVNNEMNPHIVHGYMPNAGLESTRTTAAENCHPFSVSAAPIRPVSRFVLRRTGAVHRKFLFYTYSKTYFFLKKRTNVRDNFQIPHHKDR